MQQASLPAAGGTAGFAIRSATLADAPVIAALAEALNRSEGDPSGYITAATMERDLAAGRIEVILAESAGRAIGYCLFHFGYEATYAASGLYIVDLFVVAERRRAGVGRALIAEVARRAKAAGGVFVWWTSKPGNTIANRAYARLDAFSEKLIAHAVFDESFERLAAEGEARRRDDG
jgi:GNAT superfamily N-acetyltransferase